MLLYTGCNERRRYIGDSDESPSSKLNSFYRAGPDATAPDAIASIAPAAIESAAIPQSTSITNQLWGSHRFVPTNSIRFSWLFVYSFIEAFH